MFRVLTPGFIGIRGLALPQAITLARASGFQGLDFSLREAEALVQERGLAAVRRLFAEAEVQPAQCFLPVRWAWRAEDLLFSKPPDVFVDHCAEDLAALPRLAELARELGCTRTWTYTVPGSNTLSYADNFAAYQERFRAIAVVLARYDLRLGLEFLGTLELRARFRLPFIHTLGQMIELLRAIGTSNVGLLLDMWHLYTSRGQLSDLDTLSAEDIVTVHVNDAPVGLAPEEQTDNVRCLPMETGVLDGPGFMRRLAALGYTGPITPEPFSARVNAITDPLVAAQTVAATLDRLWQAAGPGGGAAMNDVQARWIEELSLNAWPALQTVCYDGWLLRLARGYTRRANSVNPLYPGYSELAEKVAYCAQLYAAQGQDVVFKITPPALPEGLDEALVSWGYAQEALTSVQTADLRGQALALSPRAQVAETASAAWVEDYARLNDLPARHLATATQMLESIVPPHCFVALCQDGETIACGLAVAQAGYVGLYDIVTAPAYRGRGYGRELMQSLLAWGVAQGAHTAYLSVMLNNPPALRLYAGLGFGEQYRYWYRTHRKIG